jgi:hypothetical protein
MTIDERLERLTQRHEAVAETVEVMGHPFTARMSIASLWSRSLWTA